MVLVLLCDGFEESEVTVPVDLLRRGGVDVGLCGVNGSMVKSSHGITYGTDLTLDQADLAQVEMVFVPGGLGGTDGLLASAPVAALLRQAKEQGCYLAAICAGPTVLSRLGLIDGKKAVCYPGMEDLLVPAIPQKGSSVVRDGKLITAEAAGASFELGFTMLDLLRGEEVSQQVRQSVYYRG